VKCAIDDCINDTRSGSLLAICALCRASMYRWKKRRPAEVLERRRRLSMYTNRMEKLDATRRPKP